MTWVKYNDMVKNCENCGVEFKAKGSKTKFHTWDCFVESGKKHGRNKKGIWKNCLTCDVPFYTEQGAQSSLKKFHNRACYAKSRLGHRAWNKGKKFGTRECPWLRGSNNHAWKGGRISESEKIRKSINARYWREMVFKRDNFTCQLCHSRGGQLEADHILPFSIFHKLRFEPGNGRTLCKSCHRRSTNRLMTELKSGFYRGRSLEDWKIMSQFYVLPTAEKALGQEIQNQLLTQ